MEPVDPEIQPSLPEAPLAEAAPEAVLTPDLASLTPDAKEYRGLRWAFIGKQGLRAGW
jgi:hypothetical protein